jgi:ABC-type transport system substrate-binding protein
MGKNFREQIIELDSGTADLVEVAPEQGRRLTMEGRLIASSQPVELLALVFSGDPHAPEEKALRSALAHSIDRASMRSVLLQGAGIPAGGLLPNWMTGYDFAFSTDANLNLARHQREQVPAVPNWTLGYDANDSVARLLAERIALNARDAGLAVQPTGAVSADLRLVRIPLASSDPFVALTNVSAVLGMTMPKATADRGGNTIEDLYSMEQTLLASQRVIPLFHLPAEWASSPTLRDWMPGADGTRSGWENKSHDVSPQTARRVRTDCISVGGGRGMASL